MGHFHVFKEDKAEEQQEDTKKTRKDWNVQENKTQTSYCMYNEIYN